MGKSAEIRATEIKLVPLADIQLNPKNRNRHPQEQIDRLVKLIKYQGFREPGVISNRSGVLIAGEGRYLAAKQLGLNAMPCIFQDFDSDEQEEAFGVSTNAIASWAELDMAAINAELPDLGPDFDIDMLGLKDFNLDAPNFEPGTEEDQGALDRTQILECPYCEKHFERSQAKVIA